MKPLDLTTYLQEVQKTEDMIKDLMCVQLMKTDYEISQQGSANYGLCVNLDLD